MLCVAILIWGDGLGHSSILHRKGTDKPSGGRERDRVLYRGNGKGGCQSELEVCSNVWRPHSGESKHWGEGGRWKHVGREGAKKNGVKERGLPLHRELWLFL